MKLHDRSAKVNRRKRRMPVNGIAFKRLLIERAASCRFCDRPRTQHHPETGRCPGPYQPRWHYKEVNR